MSKFYKNIFIDLDNTLWDFEVNSKDTIEDIFYKYGIDRAGTFKEFYPVYKEINKFLWGELKKQRITKDFLCWNRFFMTNEKFGISDEILARNMGNDYLILSPKKTKLLPNCIELLEYLKANYKVFLITNGFKEVQYSKIKACGIENYFDKVFTSEEVGHTKPNKEYFLHVINETCSKIDESIVIGDDLENDIQGANNIGMDSIWLNLKAVVQNEVFPKYEVRNLLEIMELLVLSEPRF